MADDVRLLSPRDIRPNPENPRLIFHADELDSLQRSIAAQGILVPLTVYQDGKRAYILDGERRWRSALKLGLPRVPVVVQPKPDRMTNIMMMFAIHHARRAWDPLPTAYKLKQLEEEFEKREGRSPTELELAGIASISRGEVRRLKGLLRLPKRYLDELMRELEKPRSEQQITVDHVLEATKGAAALRKRDIVDARQEESLRRTILKKFRTGVIRSTVDPRKLARMARSVEREELSTAAARRVVVKLLDEPKYSIDDAFRESVERFDFEHSSEQAATRLEERLLLHLHRQYEPGETFADSLRSLQRTIRRVLGS